MPNLDNSEYKRFFVTGIGTDVGKTVVSAILTKALNASYWKPVQSGIVEGSDSDTIRNLVPNVNIIPERYRLKEPLSPHAAAEIDGIQMELNELNLPEVSGHLIVEGAGGLMVPFDQEGTTYLELANFWELPVVIVSRHYLGSINHTLLTIEILRSKNLGIKGVVFVGPENSGSESIIVKRTNVSVLGRIPEVENVDEAFISVQASLIRKYL